VIRTGSSRRIDPDALLAAPLSYWMHFSILADSNKDSIFTSIGRAGLQFACIETAFVRIEDSGEKFSAGTGVSVGLTSAKGESQRYKE
jgi:hypothetical protein